MECGVKAGVLWTTLALLLAPIVSSEEICPNSCRCLFSSGAVSCVGYTITDIPVGLPVLTNLLQMIKTRMHVINEQSLANLDKLLRFGLMHSHLHSIHPKAFQVAPQLKSVKLSFNDLSTIPAGVFLPLSTLEQLHLDGNRLTNIAPDMLEGLVGLLDLDLKSNKLSDLPSHLFDGLTNLTYLNLGRNNIKTLPPNIFQSLIQLRNLSISNNELESLELGMFDTLVNLEELKLHHNRISSLPPKVFWSLNKLLKLTLSSNRLQAVPEESFYHMPNLTQLTLYNNPLLSLPDQLMGFMPEMRDFYLYATNLTTVPGNLFANMSGLTLLNLHHNSHLKDLPSDLFCSLPNLHKLSLRHNKLEELPPHLFSNLTGLKILLLHDNFLKDLPKDIFHGLSLLSEIDLRNNDLKTISADSFTSNAANVSLSGNPWNCTCNIRGLVKWIKKNEHLVPDREDVTCHSPVYQRLRTLWSLKGDDFKFCDTIMTKSYQPTENNLLERFPFLTTSTTAVKLPETTSRVQDTTPQEIQPPPRTTPVITSTSTETPASKSKAMLAHYISPAFHDKLVLEQGPEYVHHNVLKGRVYVWFVPSDTAPTGILMGLHILFVATAFLLILASLYGMHRLTEMMEKLNAELART